MLRRLIPYTKVPLDGPVFAKEYTTARNDFFKKLKQTPDIQYKYVYPPRNLLYGNMCDVLRGSGAVLVDDVQVLQWYSIGASVISNIKENTQLSLLAPPNKRARATFLPHHFPVMFNPILMTNPAS